MNLNDDANGFEWFMPLDASLEYDPVQLKALEFILENVPFFPCITLLISSFMS